MHVCIFPRIKKDNADGITARAKEIQELVKPIKSLAKEKSLNKLKSATKKDSSIAIHADCKRKDGKKLDKNDIIDSHGFGNGITVLSGMTLKSGEKIPVVIMVFDDDNNIDMKTLRTFT